MPRANWQKPKDGGLRNYSPERCRESPFRKATTRDKMFFLKYPRCPMKLRKRALFCVLVFLLLPLTSSAQGQAAAPKAKPRVIVLGVNGMELDIIRPLIIKGEMPNLASIIEKGAYGKLRTVSAPNCPRVYTTVFTSTD